LIFLPHNSGGTIKLNSSDPFDKPLIDPQFLTTKFDVVAMRECVRAIKRFIAAPAWADYVLSPFGSLSATSDSDIDEYVRGLVGTAFHPVGTAAMSSHSKPGVVDQDLLVKSADGLRIVDASVFVSFMELDIGQKRFTLICSPSFRAPTHKAQCISLRRGLLISSRYRI
jgi:choline dehydrogenase-like flavoprotein